MSYSPSTNPKICQDHTHFHFIYYFFLISMSPLWKCLMDNTHYMNDLPCKKNQVCRILVCDEYGSVNLISLLSWEQSRLTPVCMCATARVGVHTQRMRSHWQEVSQGKVSGRRLSKKCVSQLSSSVRAALRVSVCSCSVLPIREVITYPHLRHKSRRVSHSHQSTAMSESDRLFIWHGLWNL